jgi:hypothetical protein
MDSMISGSTLGGWPPVQSNAKTNEVNSWPSGKPAKRTPCVSPSRATTKEGLRASLPEVSSVTLSDKPTMVSSKLFMSVPVSLSSSEAIRRIG